MSTLPTTAPQVVAVPPSFPVVLPPGEERLYWERDRTHFPAQVTPLEADLVLGAVEHGMTHALRHYEAPVHAMKLRVFHGWSYSAAVPVVAAPEQMEELDDRCAARLQRAVARLHQAWYDELLPEILRHLDAMQAVDVRLATAPALADHLEDCRSHLLRLWEIHFEVVLPAYLAVSEFEDLHNELFEGSGFDAYTLLGGAETKTFAIGRDLWRLSRLALTAPEVLEVLESAAAAEAPLMLARTEAGRAFLAELDAHLDAYGHRSPWWGLATPTFREDPAQIIKLLRDLLGRPDGADPGIALRRQLADRDAATAAARERLRGYPAMIVGHYEAMLAAARTGLLLTEDHGFYLDGWSLAAMRRVVVELGRRLAAAGAIAGTDDVQFLTADELATAARHLPIADLHDQVAARRADHERDAGTVCVLR